MLKHKLILSALVAGSLTLGAAFAGDRPELTDEQKARFAELRAKLEGSGEGRHGGLDSLRAAHRGEIRRHIDHIRAGGALSDERKALRAEVKALVEDYKAKIGAAAEEDKAALKAELKEKIKALHDAFRAEHKATLDSLKAARQAHIAAHKARLEEIRKDVRAKGDALRKDRPALTDAQKAELRKRLEDCIKQDDGEEA